MHLALLALTVTVPQASIPVAPIAGEYDRHGVVHYDVDSEGDLWARGRSYKASAGSTGFEFIPFLGSEAPRNYPLRLRLQGVTRGDELLAIDETAAVTRAGDRVVLDRGAVRVRYDLATESIEQSFVLDSAPGSGDLVLRLSAKTDLAPTGHQGGFRFSNELGGVEYGAAIAIDSGGEAVDVAASWSAGQISLTVPGEFLESASWPIVVDPLLTPFSVGTSPARLTNPDAADDWRGEQLFVVYEERFSGSDVDVFSAFVTRDGTVGSGAYVDQTSASWTNPRVSGSIWGSFALIVAEADSAAMPGSTDIVSRGRSGDGTSFPPRVLFSAMPGYSCAAPAIGTDGDQGSGGAFLVAYNRVYSGRRDIHYGLTTGFSTPTDRPLAVSPTADASEPAVSEMSGTCCGALEYVVAWAERDVATGASSVKAALVRFDGGTFTGPFSVAGPRANALYIDVDVSTTTRRTVPGFAGFSYIVTYDDRPSSVTDAFVAVCSGTTVHNTYELQLSEHADRGPNQNSLRVATGWSSITLGYEENGELYMTLVELIGGELGIVERRRMAPGASLAPGSLALAGTPYIFPRTLNGFFVWEEDGATSPGISGSLVTVPTVFAEAAGIQYCYGNANSTGDRGFIQVSGNRRVGHPHDLRVEALPANAFGYFLSARSTGVVPNAGGSQGTLCLGGAIGRFGIYQADSNGFAARALNTQQIPTSTGFGSAVAGARWYFQSWHRDAVGGSATSNFTNAVCVLFR